MSDAYLAEPSPPPSRTADLTVARVAMRASEFVFASLFECDPGMQVTLEPAVANPADHALVVVRADEADRGTVERAFDADPAVAAVERFGLADDGWRYRVTWDGRVCRLVRAIVAEGTTLSMAHARSGRWKLRLLATEREAITRAYERFETFGCEPDLLSLTTGDDGIIEDPGVSDDQREAVVTAFEMGYYEVPRHATATEVATELDISHQALSERFRRAHERLVGTRFVFEDDGAESS